MPETPISPDGSRTAWPRRRNYALLASLFTAIAIYGSLVPLRFQAIEFADAVARFRQIPFLRLGIQSRADWVANILLFLPIGYFWMAAATVDRRGARLGAFFATLVVLLCMAGSVTLEFTQLWLPLRTVSKNDIVAETIGGLLGAGLWLLVGQAVTEWIRSYTATRQPKRQFEWILQVYLAGLLIGSVLPLDLTIRVGEIIDKYRAGRILLVPFSDFRPTFGAFYGLFCDAAIFVPVGMFAATSFRSARRPVRSARASILLGGLIVLAIEGAQLLVYSRHTASGDVICGILGVGVGAWIVRRWLGGSDVSASEFAFSSHAKRTWLWLAVAGVYTVFLVVLFCGPLDEIITDPQELKMRYQGFWKAPFAALYPGSEFNPRPEVNAVLEVLKKTLFYVPLGVFFAMAATSLTVPRAIRRLLLAALLLVTAGIATSIEMAQVFLPTHRPDVIDVMLCSVGAAIGMFLAVRLIGAGRRDA